MFYKSKVPECEGLCFCTWRNTNAIDNRIDGFQTGYFRLLRNPFKEFHGGFFRNLETGKTVILSTERRSE